MFRLAATALLAFWAGALAMVAFLKPVSYDETTLNWQRHADTRYVEGVIYGARIATLKCFPTYTGKR